MKNLLVACALLVMTSAVAPKALKAAGAQCPLGNGTKHGTYVVHGTGTIVGLGPLAAVGEITYDGQGHSIATYTASVNGTIHKGVTVTGTYTVNPDCTGSHAESDGSHYDFVVSPDGNTATWISTDAGTVVTGTEVRLKPTDVEDAALLGPRDTGGIQLPLGDAARTRPLAVSRLSKGIARSERSGHVRLARIAVLRMETT
jgi:hypothetical protein